MTREPPTALGRSGGIFGEPRGRLLGELCGHPRTAVELAARVGTSSNAVRVHLEALRLAGLVEFSVERRGVGKPTHVYSLTAAAEYLVSSAYAPALQAILGTLKRQQGKDFPNWLRDAGSALARRPSIASRRGSVEAAVELLHELGAEVMKGREGRDTVLRTGCCPLGAATRTTPETCKLLEGALGAVVTTHRVTERCERGAHPRCAFILTRETATTVRE